MIDKATLNELVNLRTKQVIASEALTDALKEQAEEHKISKTALRQYVAALEKGEVDKLQVTSSDLAKLIEEGEECGE